MKAPETLKARTRRAAQEMREGQTPQAPRGRMKRVLAAACALAVLAGGAAIGGRSAGERAPGSAAILNSFGLVAYAADTDETIQPQSSTIVFDAAAGGMNSPEKGFFSGCLFKVTGENIASVSASMDKGGLYRSSRKYIQESDVQEIMEGKSPLTADADDIMAMSDPERTKWWVDISQRVENGFTEAYDPDTSYGFWAAPKGSAAEDDLAQAWHERTDEFEGATLSVTVTFTDGSQQTQTLKLHTGNLAVEYPDDGSGPHYTGEVLTDEQAKTESYLYGVYAEIQQ